MMKGAVAIGLRRHSRNARDEDLLANMSSRGRTSAFTDVLNRIESIRKSPDFAEHSEDSTDGFRKSIKMFHAVGSSTRIAVTGLWSNYYLHKIEDEVSICCIIPNFQFFFTS